MLDQAITLLLLLSIYLPLEMSCIFYCSFQDIDPKPTSTRPSCACNTVLVLYSFCTQLFSHFPAIYFPPYEMNAVSESESSCSVKLHQRAIKLKITPQANSPNTYTDLALTCTHLFLVFHPFIFLPLAAVHFCPIQMNGGLESESSCSVMFPLRARKLHSTAQTRSCNTHPTAICLFLYCIINTLTLSCRNVCMYSLLWIIFMVNSFSAVEYSLLTVNCK